MFSCFLFFFLKTGPPHKSPLLPPTPLSRPLPAPGVAGAPAPPPPIPTCPSSARSWRPPAPRRRRARWDRRGWGGGARNPGGRERAGEGGGGEKGGFVGGPCF